MAGFLPEPVTTSTTRNAARRAGVFVHPQNSVLHHLRVMFPCPDSKFQCRPKYPISRDYPSNFVSALGGPGQLRETTHGLGHKLTSWVAPRCPLEAGERKPTFILRFLSNSKRLAGIEFVGFGGANCEQFVRPYVAAPARAGDVERRRTEPCREPEAARGNIP